MSRHREPYSVSELLLNGALVLLVLFFVARLVFGEEIRELENALFKAVGLEGSLKYLIIIPLALPFYWRLFRREKASAKAKGVPLISAYSKVFCIVSVVAIVLYLFVIF